MEKLHLIIVTGMSGAGRSTALHVLEDLGFFCVDNLPPALAPQLLELLGKRSESEPMQRVGLGVDVRTGSFMQGAGQVIESLKATGHDVEVIFLDCSDDSLVRRYSESRRPHPLAPQQELLSAIRQERARLGPLREWASHVIDTTDLNVHGLRQTMVEHVARSAGQRQMATTIQSFGFKYGLPVNADLVFDLRFLPNPHFVPELRPKTGVDPEVARFVMTAQPARELLDELVKLLGSLLPQYEREGKAYLTVALGCTGGRHRSVAFAEALAQQLQREGLSVVHRDASR